MRVMRLWLCSLIVVSACSVAPAPGKLQIPDCLDGSACVQGFAYDGRVYGLICTGVTPDAVSATAVALVGGHLSKRLDRSMGLPPRTGSPFAERRSRVSRPWASLSNTSGTWP